MRVTRTMTRALRRGGASRGILSSSISLLSLIVKKASVPFCIDCTRDGIRHCSQSRTSRVCKCDASWQGSLVGRCQRRTQVRHAQIRLTVLAVSSTAKTDAWSARATVPTITLRAQLSRKPKLSDARTLREDSRKSTGHGECRNGRHWEE